MALIITITFLFAALAATFLVVHWPAKPKPGDHSNDA